MPVIWCSGEVGRMQVGTVEVPGGFIGASAATALARLWRDAGHVGAGVLWRVQSASNTWLFASALVLPSVEWPKCAYLAL
jgi:hypothetical protein